MSWKNLFKSYRIYLVADRWHYALQLSISVSCLQLGENKTTVRVWTYSTSSLKYTHAKKTIISNSKARRWVNANNVSLSVHIHRNLSVMMMTLLALNADLNQLPSNNRIWHEYSSCSRQWAMIFQWVGKPTWRVQKKKKKSAPMPRKRAS